MCTVTLVPREDGFRLTCNRDERRTRPVALAPRLYVLPARVALFPVDPPSGGTWVGINDAGLAMTILNRTIDAAPLALRLAPRSRGAIIPALLKHARLADALEAAAALDPACFGLFCLILVQRPTVGVVTSDGRSVSIEVSRLRRPAMFTSSSLGDSLVAEPRRGLFERLVLHDERSWLRGQRRFHRHRWTRRPKVSVMMERPDARTVSQTVIDVTRVGIGLRYAAMEPAEARPVDSRLSGAA